MKAKITKIQRHEAHAGGYCWLITFSVEDGRSARAYVYESHGNFRRWQPHLGQWQMALAHGQEVILDKLVWKNEGSRLINGDSFFQIVKQAA